MAAARSVREAGVGAVFIDTSPRAQPHGDRFARAMGAVYAPLPYVQAAALSELVAGARTALR
jgi:magnesium chelatase subunit D